MDFRLFLKDGSKIVADDVIKLRREVFDDMIVSLPEAEGVFELNDLVDDTCAEWDAFFVEALTDYCVNQANPRGYVSDTNADWLIKQITRDGHVKSDTELELLVKIIERAHQVPDLMATFALKEVANAVLEGDGELLRDETLTRGVIGQPEAQLIRRIVYGVGADGQIKISRREVEVLFDLNDKTAETENHPEWHDVFVRAVAAYLMMSGGYQALPTDEVMRREEWMNDTSIDPAGMLAKTFGSLSSIFSDGRFTTPTSNGEEAWRKSNREDELTSIGSEVVDATEAAWLAERIGRDGVLHENEKALLKFLKEESPNIDGALQPLLDKVS